MSPDDLAYTSATDLAALIADRQISAVEAVDAAITRIEARNPALNAVVYKGYDDARREARAADDELTRGERRGPLHGVPTLIKDLFDFKPGWPATFGGIPALADQVLDLYCPFAERVEGAGAILVGKTNSPVMGMRGTCDNPLFGPSRNPFDLTKNTGGSSGGSAAAVADGLVPFAEGTDAGGSIRIPSAWCGVYGYKPSWGRVPVILRPDAFAGTEPFVAEGPITRTVGDAALVMSVLAGHDSRDPYSLPDPQGITAAPDGDLRGKRVAFTPDFGVYSVDPRVASVVRSALEGFADAGATVHDVRFDLPYDQVELADLWCRMIAPLNIGTIEGLKAGGVDLLGEHRGSMPPDYVRRIEEGYEMTVLEYQRDRAMRTAVTDAIQAVLDEYDFLASPTVSCTPVDNTNDGDTKGPASVNGDPTEPLIGWCLTYFANFSGHPAASIPAGLVDDRWPAGLQLIGRRHRDSDLLAASAAFEKARPWGQLYERCRNRPAN